MKIAAQLMQLQGTFYLKYCNKSGCLIKEMDLNLYLVGIFIEDQSERDGKVYSLEYVGISIKEVFLSILIPEVFSLC